MLPFPSVLLGASAAAPAGYGAHKAWRVFINSNNGDTQYCVVRECELRTVAGGATITTGGTAFQGGPGADAGNGVGAPWDGNLTNTWARTIAGGYGFFYGYMWATPKSIVEVGIYADGLRAPVDWKLQYSDDTTDGTDGTWTDAFTAWERSWDTVTNADSWRSWPQDFSGGKYKAFRFLVSANNGDRYCAMTEAEIHATIGGADFSNSSGCFGSTNDINAEPYRLWDNSNSFRWIVDTTVGGILPAYSATALATPAAKPAEYALTNTDGSARGWAAWKLQGTVDGAAWTDLDNRSAITWLATTQTQTFAVLP